MNEKLSEEIVKVLQSAQDAASLAAGFVADKAPELCRQIVAWELWNHGIWLAIDLALLVFSAVAVVRTSRKLAAMTSADWNTPIPGLPRVLCVCAALTTILVASICASDNASRVIKASTAPALVVLDYVKAAVK